MLSLDDIKVTIQSGSSELRRALAELQLVLACNDNHDPQTIYDHLMHMNCHSKLATHELMANRYLNTYSHLNVCTELVHAAARALLLVAMIDMYRTATNRIKLAQGEPVHRL